jgi:catechol 2,3-dioxygenase-like lactoylglutathione lyase family enzyme
VTSNQEPTTLAEFGGHEIYPMPMFATLAVADVAAVAAWYERALGFATVFRAPDAGGQPALIHLRRRKYQDLLFDVGLRTPVGPGAGSPGSHRVGRTPPSRTHRSRAAYP